MEIIILIKLLVVVPLVWIWGYPRGYCDWVLPNRLRRYKKGERVPTPEEYEEMMEEAEFERDFGKRQAPLSPDELKRLHNG